MIDVLFIDLNISDKNNIIHQKNKTILEGYLIGIELYFHETDI